MASEAMVVDAQVTTLTLREPPTEVLAEATTAARALGDVIGKKAKKVMMNGEQYLEFEDWQTLGRFYGITACEDGDAEYVVLDGISGFKASAIARDRDGRILSRATAFCLRDEEKWGERTKYAWAYVKRSGGHSIEDPGKDELVWEERRDGKGNAPKKEKVVVGVEAVPLYQLSSMAQTRAAAKALRNVLSWVAVLAGYKPTPAEEMNISPQAAQSEPSLDNIDEAQAYRDAGVEPPAQPVPTSTAAMRQPPPPPAQGAGKACPNCGKTLSTSRYPKEGRTLYCGGGCKGSFRPEDVK